jgi:hypothetical protein
MRKRRLVLGLLIASAVTFVGGCTIPATKAYPQLGPVTRVEVNVRSEAVKVIDDPAQVTRIVEFVDSHCRGWGGNSDMFGVPIPRVAANFYNGNEFKGRFGVGAGFFETQREGDFASQRAGSQEEREFLELLGVGDYLYKP